MRNRLADAVSPYLRQHADNPVAWQPWDDEALALARSRNVPILLSVGYSACHWCHVMEHESFADAELATFLNAHFVPIKVDREERPDLDTLYMIAVQAFSRGHGGWPMTLVLTPDGRPFFGGTYFPPEPRHGMPSFQQVLAWAHHVWTEDRERAEALAAKTTRRIEEVESPPELAGPTPADWLLRVRDAALERFDDLHGGFTGAPKFPPHGTLAALLAHHARTGDEDALSMVVTTLDAMTRGGTWDLLDGGLCRYSTDERWAVPHFEKMLYDNAQLVPVLVDAWRASGENRFARLAIECLDYVARDLTGPEGAFLSSEDADTEGGEGLFHTWTPGELVEVLGPEEGPAAAERFEVTAEGTFEHGRSVLRLDTPRELLPPEERDRVERWLIELQRARARRTRPARDTKRITAWNALMIRAFAVAGPPLEASWYVDRACVAARHLLDHHVVDGRLHRVWSDGAAHHLGCLDDHAHLVLALVDLYEATFDVDWLREALRLVDATLALFWDEEAGTLSYTGRDAPPLIARPRRQVGGAEPSAHTTLAWALARLAHLCERPELGALADRLLAAWDRWAAEAPGALGYEAIAHGWRHGPLREVAIVLPSDDVPLRPLLRELYRRADPFRVVAGALADDIPPELPWLQGRRPLGRAPTAFVCTGRTCLTPTDRPAELRAQLDAGRPTP